MRRRRFALMAIGVATLAIGELRAFGDAALLMEEPYAQFEPSIPRATRRSISTIFGGVAYAVAAVPCGRATGRLSAYHKIDGTIGWRFRWFLICMRSSEWRMYRRRRMRRSRPACAIGIGALICWAYAPDVAEGKKAGEAPGGEWTQLIGASYDRRIYGFQIQTTPEEDEKFMNKFNDSRNEGHFNLLFHNCADFSRTLLNVYYPHSIHRNFFVDMGITTPKQVARSLTKYADRHPELTFSTFMIPQVPGSIKRSHSIDGVMKLSGEVEEYVLIAVLNPEVAAALRGLPDGRRFKAPADATVEIIPGETVTKGVDLAGSRCASGGARDQTLLQPAATPSSGRLFSSTT
jgi:hypothetical protein